MANNGEQQPITPEDIKRALRSLSDLGPEERTDLLTDVVRNVLPPLSSEGRRHGQVPDAYG